MLLQQPLTAARIRDLAVLQRQLRLARESPRFVRVTGEPWIGKSRLLRQLAVSARQDGWAVAAGRAPRAGGRRPFDVLVDALDDHLARADGSLFDDIGAVNTRALAPLFPALGTLAAADAEPEPYAVIRAVRALIGRLAAPGGLLLVLDDVHRAGPEVFDLVDHLVRHPPAGRVLTVFAHRTVPAGRHLSAVPYDSSDVRHLELRPLPEADARGLLPAGMAPLAVELALRDAGGVPGLLHALARGVVPGGRCRVVHGSADLAEGVPPVLGRDAIDLHTLSSLGWRSACAGAVLGDPFTAASVARTAGLPLEDALRGLDELYGEGLLRADGSCTRFRFARPAVRALVHHAAGAGWRSAALERALDALRADPEAGRPLAAHLENAPRLDLADLETLARSVTSGLYTRPARSLRSLRRLTADFDGPAGLRILHHKALVVSGRLEEAVAGHAESGLRPHEPVPVGGRTEAAVWHARALRLSGRHAEARSVLDGDGGLQAPGTAPAGPDDRSPGRGLPPG
ncbi:AAA family ATPase [Streptomyces bambusae]|uniref:AAA family ATPase n=1 Tax=Streptomyces bambusae TaxID=1550616 RepID=A0ABS6ZGU5_9ACTN|nr:AAA family ATPase [Streptomyces bambusae]